MTVYACLKDVPNVEGLSVVDPEAGFLQADAWLMNPLDGYALQEALKAAKALHTSCVVVSAGRTDGEQTLRHALALGAQRGVLVAPASALAGPVTTALYLAAAITADSQEHNLAPQLVFCGRQSSDVAGMQVPYRVAALLGMGVVSDVSDWEVATDSLRIKRQSGSLYQVLEADMPCVLAVNRGPFDLPRPTLPGIMQAKKKTVRILSCEEATRFYTADYTDPSLVRVLPPQKERQVRMAEGATVEEKVSHLLRMLREDGCPIDNR